MSVYSKFDVGLNERNKMDNNVTDTNSHDLSEGRIVKIREQYVIIDKDLAELYQVTTGNLNKAVKRNIKRFPPDFMFQLTKEKWQALRFQNGIIKKGRGEHTKYFPYAFTEQGLAMLSGLLNCKPPKKQPCNWSLSISRWQNCK